MQKATQIEMRYKYLEREREKKKEAAEKAN